MALSFDGTAFQGTHGGARYTPIAIRPARFKFPGVDGVSEVRLGKGERAITYDITIHGAFANASDVVSHLAEIDAVVDTHGALVESGTVTQTFANCTFHGFEPTSNILPGILGGSEVGGWFVVGRLAFVQLKET